MTTPSADAESLPPTGSTAPQIRADSAGALNRDPAVYFSEAYQDLMYSGAVGRYSDMVHRMMERRYAKGSWPRVIEVGAGSGQHLPYVQHDFRSYLVTDIAPDNSGVTCPDPRVTREVLDAQDLSQHDTGAFDRLVATCLLAHLDRPEHALSEWRRVVRPGGALTIFVPMEPGLALRTARSTFVVRKSRRLGQDHRSLVYRDHRNHYPGMRVMIDEVFRTDQVSRRRFPIAFVGWNLALFEIVHIVRGAEDGPRSR